MTALHPLAESVDHPAPARDALPRWRLLAGLVLAPAAYSLLIVTGYTIAANACAARIRPSAAVVLVTVVALGAILAGLAISIGNFRRTRDEGGGGHAGTQDIGDGRTRFLAYFGLCASGLFALAVVVQLTSFVLLDQCLGLPALP